MSKKALVAIIMVLLMSKLYAHENKVVHPFVLTSKAFDMFYKTGPNAYYHEEFKYYFNPAPMNYGTLPIPLQGTLGTIEEDEPLGIRCLNHFYNPYNPPTYEPWWGFMPGVKNAVEWGKPLWEGAIERYGEGKKSEGFLALGRVLHLLEDMSSPPHVHSDAHIVGNGNFEKWAYTSDGDNELEFLRQLDGRNIKGFSGWDRFLIDLAEYTYEAVKIEGSLMRDEYHPGEGDLVEMFPEIAYLRYIPVGGEDPISGEVSTKDFWWIYSVGYCYSGPEMKTTTEGIYGMDDWWRCGPATGGEYYYIENPRYAFVYDYRLIPHIGPWANQPKDLCKIWVEDYKLFPMTIEYTAGLMNLGSDKEQRSI